MNAQTLEALAFRVDVVADDDGRVLARGFCSWETLRPLEGRLQVTLQSPQLEHIGTFRALFLVATELSHPQNHLGGILRRWWSPGLPMISIGHRGSGESQTARGKGVRENTLLSFMTAASSKAMQYIEFDVHMTLDGEVVIYHDFDVKLAVGDRVLKAGIPTITLAKLQSTELAEAMVSASELRSRGQAARQRRNREVFEQERNLRRSTLKRSASGDENMFREAGFSKMMEEIQAEREAAKSPAGSMVGGEDKNAGGGRGGGGGGTHGRAEDRAGAAGTTCQNNHGAGNSEISAARGTTPASSSDHRDPFKDEDRGWHEKAALEAALQNDDGIIESSEPAAGHDPGAVGPLTASSWTLRDRVATLREMFRQLPKWLGFNVEIKYPTDQLRNRLPFRMYPRNTFIDAVLTVVMTEAKDRPVIFSTFDPDCATLLSLKQPRYPVFFLTCSGTERYADPRMDSLEAAVAFACASNLHGVVAESTPLQGGGAHDLVQTCHGLGMSVFTWGPKNNDHAFFKAQREAGVDAVISDDLFRFQREEETEQRSRSKREAEAPRGNIEQGLAVAPSSGGASATVSSTTRSPSPAIDVATEQCPVAVTTTMAASAAATVGPSLLSSGTTDVPPPSQPQPTTATASAPNDIMERVPSMGATHTLGATPFSPDGITRPLSFADLAPMELPPLAHPSLQPVLTQAQGDQGIHGDSDEEGPLVRVRGRAPASGGVPPSALPAPASSPTTSHVPPDAPPLATASPAGQKEGPKSPSFGWVGGLEGQLGQLGLGSSGSRGGPSGPSTPGGTSNRSTDAEDALAAAAAGVAAAAAARAGNHQEDANESPKMGAFDHDAESPDDVERLTRPLGGRAIG